MLGIPDIGALKPKSGLPDLRIKRVPDLGYTQDRVLAPQDQGGEMQR